MFDTRSGYGFSQGEGYVSTLLVVKRDIAKLRDEDRKRIEDKLKNLYKASDVVLDCKLSITYVDRLTQKSVDICSEPGLYIKTWAEKMRNRSYNCLFLTYPFFKDCELKWANNVEDDNMHALNENIVNFEVNKLTKLLNRPIFIS